MSNVVHLTQPVQEQQAQAQPTTDVPEFITAKDISQMNDEQLDELIVAIRARRGKAMQIYNRTKDDLPAVAASKAGVALEKKCDMVIKDLNATDKALERLEKHIQEIRGLRIQAGLTVI